MSDSITSAKDTLYFIKPETDTEESIKASLIDYGKFYTNGKLGLTKLFYALDNIDEDEFEDFKFNYEGHFDETEINAFIEKYNLPIQ